MSSIPKIVIITLLVVALWALVGSQVKVSAEIPTIEIAFIGDLDGDKKLDLIIKTY